MKIILLSFLVAFCICGISHASDADPYVDQRKKMVEEQIRQRGIQDERVLRAMLNVPRHLFIPRKSWHEAYEDHPVFIGHGQTISQPAIVGYMTDILKLKADDRVLEIGTGSGYQAAILAEIIQTVYTIEIVKPLAIQAQKRLAGMGYENIEVFLGDGYQGWPEHAPFDAIIVTAAPHEVPQELVKQLKVGGRMVIPVGEMGAQHLQLITKSEAGVVSENIFPVSFVPMIKGQP